jgi:hypothetical protein
MYPQYPGGNDAPERAPSAPPSVIRAVRVMYAGAVLSLVGIVINLVTFTSLRSAIGKANPALTAAQVNSAEHVAIGISIAGGLIGAALWLWMVQSCRAGKSWARIVSTVLFGIDTLSVIASFARVTNGAAGRIFSIVIWLVGLAAIILLWQRESSAYFGPGRRRY